MDTGQIERRNGYPRMEVALEAAPTDTARPATPHTARQEAMTSRTEEHQTTSATHSGERPSRAPRKHAHYQRIGAMGGTKVRDRHGVGYYQKIGQRGGEVTSRTMSQEHFREIGQLGGRISALRRRAKRWRDDQEEWRDLDTLASRDDWQDWFE